MMTFLHVFLCFSSICHVKKLKILLCVQDAMNIVKISKQDQENVFTMVAAVLWLGNITFSEIDHENHVSVNDNEGEPVILGLILNRTCFSSKRK